MAFLAATRPQFDDLPSFICFLVPVIPEFTTKNVYSRYQSFHFTVVSLVTFARGHTPRIYVNQYSCVSLLFARGRHCYARWST